MIKYQFLLEINAVDNNGQDVTIRKSCGQSYTGGGHTWTPGIVDPGLFQVNLFSGSRTSGSSSHSYGEIIINSMKGVYASTGPADDLTTYTYAGRLVKMYVGLDSEPFENFKLVYTATIESINFDWENINFTLRDFQSLLTKPFTASGKFLGNNVLPEGYEGVSSDLKDQNKPHVLGRVYNIAPTLCNTSKLIYAVSPLHGISNEEFFSNLKVYDSGIELYNAGVKNDLMTEEPPPGHYYTMGGYFRLGANPVGLVTCDCAEKGFATTSTPVNLVNRILELSGYSYMKGTSVLSDTGERGVYSDGDETNISDIIDAVLAPHNYWYFDNTGKIVMDSLKDPSTWSPVFTATSDVNIESFTRTKQADTASGVPASKVTLRYAKNYNVQKDTAGAVPAERKAWLAEEYRNSSLDSTQPLHPFSEELIIDTLMTYEDSEVLALLAELYTVPREIIEIVLLPVCFLEAIDLQPGNCVALDLNGRFGYTNKNMIIVGITSNYVDEQVTLTLWG